MFTFNTEITKKSYSFSDREIEMVGTVAIQNMIAVALL
jgi:hypothetical protein